MHSESAPIPSEHITDCFLFFFTVTQTCVLPVWRLPTLMHTLHFAPVIVAWRHLPQEDVLSQIRRSHKRGPTFPGSDDVTRLRQREVLGRWRPRRSLCTPQGRMVAVRKQRKIKNRMARGGRSQQAPPKMIYTCEKSKSYEEKSWWIAQKNVSMSLTSFKCNLGLECNTLVGLKNKQTKKKYQNLAKIA